MAADNADAECPREFNSRCNRFNFVRKVVGIRLAVSVIVGTLKVRRKRIFLMGTCHDCLIWFYSAICVDLSFAQRGAMFLFIFIFYCLKKILEA